VCVRLFSCIMSACILYYCNMVRWAWLDWGLSGWLTTLLQCFDTVGWVIRPVKTVGHITYIVLMQTLNHAQSINQSINQSISVQYIPDIHSEHTVAVNFYIFFLHLILLYFCVAGHQCFRLLVHCCVKWYTCKHILQLNEIKQCKDCYYHSNKKNKDWFCMPCVSDPLCCTPDSV